MIAMDSNFLKTRQMPHQDEIRESYQRIRSEVEDRLLERILLDYLAAATPVHLPGGEGLRNCDILHEYPALSHSGIVPSQGELSLRHPELCAAIDRFFIRIINS